MATITAQAPTFNSTISSTTHAREWWAAEAERIGSARTSRWHVYDRTQLDGAPQPTVEALMYSLRERGIKALEEQATKRRLSELSEEQLHEVCGRLQRFKPEIARAWRADEIAVLVDRWNSCHG